MENMMKRIYSNSRVFMFLVSALMLVGCYKDKGNYDYTLNTMNEIKSVTFSPSLVMST